MKKVNIISLVVLLVILGYVFYYSYFSNNEVYPDFIVTMSDEGFFPNSITINKGTKVIFVNKGVNLHWPASDFHPTHGIYPEFDPLKGINLGEEWLVVLKSGKWHYHDHLYPNLTGTVEVIK